MKKLKAFVPMAFFKELLPYNAELPNGNAMVVRACGVKPDDGSILRSTEYLLFGNGLATLLPEASGSRAFGGRDGYVMEFVQKKDARQIVYWEVNAVKDQGDNPGENRIQK
jgi:hypothetical protein